MKTITLEIPIEFLDEPIGIGDEIDIISMIEEGLVEIVTGN